MKINNLLVVLVCLISTTLLAQTKKIAFESHSGNPDNFNIALTNELFDIDESDFGIPSHSSMYDLRKIIFISDSVTVIVGKRYLKPWGAADSLFKFVGNMSDTLYNDEVFAKKNSPERIKYLLKGRSGGVNVYKIDSVMFESYKNKKPVKTKPGNNKPVENKQNIIPLAIPQNSSGGNPPFDMQLALMLGSILFLSLAGGWLSLKFYRPRIQKQLV